jgi:hypothetical protein
MSMLPLVLPIVTSSPSVAEFWCERLQDSHYEASASER